MVRPCVYRELWLGHQGFDANSEDCSVREKTVSAVSIRTEEHLSDALAEDIIWRKREITVLRWLLERATPDRRPTLLRAAIALVYAHWEGFIKRAAASYLEFLHYRRLRYSDLAPNFVALSARAILRRGSAANKFAAHLEVTTFFLSKLGETSRIPYKDGVDTGSNLSSALLSEIVDTLGLDFAPFESKSNLIDERLLRLRNTIAHGEYMFVDQLAVDELADEVVGMLEAFRAQIENAVVLRRYRAGALVLDSV